MKHIRTKKKKSNIKVFSKNEKENEQKMWNYLYRKGYLHEIH